MARGQSERNYSATTSIGQGFAHERTRRSDRTATAIQIAALRLVAAGLEPVAEEATDAPVAAQEAVEIDPTQTQ